MMFGKPGSLTMYSTAKRGGLMTSDKNCYAGPADYNVTTGNIKKRDEAVAPFDTTGHRIMYKFDFMPGPAAYLPKLPKYGQGTAVLRPDHFPAQFRRGARTPGPGPSYKPMDHFTKLMIDAKMMATKKPRVNFEKFVSNSCPTIYHPEDVRCFVEGMDGRMYPWKINRVNKTPGPIYNTYGVTTSKTRSSPVVNFSNSAERPPLFKINKGFGPADFTICRDLNTQGGVMLGQTSDPKKSDLRYFDIMSRQAIRDHIPHPFAYSIPSCFDKEAPRAVSAPFKSRTKIGDAMKPQPGPGPAAHFKPDIPLEQIVKNCKSICIPAPEPSIIKSFNTTEPRFFNPEINEMEYMPSPDAYSIPGFAQEMEEKLRRHRPAFRNPKLGFLVSADARPKYKDRLLNNISRSSPRRPWKNIRPNSSAHTYPYHGPPPKYPNSPGPIYNSNPGYISTKAKKSWNDPRRFIHDTAFLVSGCCRELKLSNMDMNIPGPGKYYSMLPPSNCGGKLSTGKKRFSKSERVGPGPVHKLHEKADSSVWRGTHLGTYNSKLKQIGISYPSAGGFHAKELNQAADKAWHIQRKDDYAVRLKNPRHTKLMAPVLKVSKNIVMMS